MYASVCVFRTGKINIGIILRIRIHAHVEKRNYAQFTGLKSVGKRSLARPTLKWKHSDPHSNPEPGKPKPRVILTILGQK